MSKSKEEIAQYLIATAVGKFVANEEELPAFYAALKKHQEQGNGEDHADMLELAIPEGTLGELFLTNDFEGQSVDGLLALIDAEILALKQFLASVLDGDFVGYMDMIRVDLAD